MPNVLFINNHGGGYGDHIDVPEGTTIDAFFQKHMEGQSVAGFLVRVNRQPVSEEQVLQEGDRISITPMKVQGAIARILNVHVRPRKWTGKHAA